jgi:hypothetical protein
MWVMNNLRNADSIQLNRLIDFVALGATFYISCMTFSVEIGSSLVFHMLAYSSILLVFVRLSKRKIASCFTSAGESTRLILGNAIGILIGACIMLLLEKVSPFHTNFSLVIILSSVMAFFVLGTIGPLVQTSLVNRCLGNYDFDQIAYFAKKRFVEGFNTLTLLEQAESEREKEEIALVCLLDVEDDKIRELQLCCRHSYVCKVVGCRGKLEKIIEEELDRQALA